MLSIFVIQLLLISRIWCAEENKKTMLGAQYYDGKKIVLPLPGDASVDLLNHWLHQAAGSVMSAFVTNRIKKGTNLNEHHQHRYQTCAKSADTVQKHARCVVNVLNAEKMEIETHENIQTVPHDSLEALLKRYFVQERITPEPPTERKEGEEKTEPEKKQDYGKARWRFQDDPVPATQSTPESYLQRTSLLFQKYRHKTEQRNVRQYNNSVPAGWIGGFHVLHERRTKRKITVINRDSYTMATEGNSRTPWGQAARIMKKIIRQIKGKRNLNSWHVTLAEIKELGEFLRKKESRKKKIKEQVKQLASAQQRRTAIDELRRIASPKRNFRKRFKQVEVEIKDFDGTPMGFEEQLEEQILEGKKRFFARPLKLLREGIKLGLMLAGKNITGFENKTVRFASPKFLAIVPEEERDEEVRFISPSLFNFHEGGDELERLLSIPSFIRAIKSIKDGDHEDLLDFIFEAAGVTDALDTAKEKLKKRPETVNSARGIDGQPLYFTKENATEIYGDIEKRKIDTFETLYATLTPQQKNDLNETGYAALSDIQLHLIYGENSPYSNAPALDRLTNITDKQRLHHLLVQDIRLIANATTFGIQKNPTHNRSKRTIVLAPIVLSPVILAPAVVSQPIILSPLLLSPVILSPAIFGPFILSPWAFIPLILSPRILSPFIVNPVIFSPIILSPLCLHPFILAPGVLNPIILNPLALSPLILSPQALTPIILTPMVLNPLILTPMTLSPLVLSPFALSPIVLSPQYIFALVLSPYVLSPLIASNLTVSAIILSPSFLS